MRTILLVWFSLFSTFADAQSTFMKTIGGVGMDYGTGIQTNDGGYIFAGGTESFGIGNTDIYIVRTDQNGDTIWTRTLGGVQFERALDIIQTSDSGFAITGDTRSFGAGQYDMFLIRLSGNGNIIWEKTFGGAMDEVGNSIIETHDGGFAIGGYTYTFGAGAGDGYVVRTDAAGNQLWANAYGTPNGDGISSIIETFDHNLVFTGTSAVGPNRNIIFLVKADHNGDTIWTRSFSTSSLDISYDISECSDSGLVLVGRANDTHSLIMKTDSGGIPQWRKSGSAGQFDELFSVIHTHNGDIAFTGWTTSNAGDDDVVFGIVDNDGNFLSFHSMGGPLDDQGASIFQTNDEGFILAVDTRSFGIGNWELMMDKTDSTGNFNCHQTNRVVIFTNDTVMEGNFVVSIIAGGITNSISMTAQYGGIPLDVCDVGFITPPINEHAITIFPNPAAGDHIKINSSVAFDRFEIYDMNGKMILNGVPDADGEISIPEESGVYFVKIIAGENSFIEKLIKL